MKKILRRNKKKKKIDDYIKKKIQTHNDLDKVKEIAFNSFKKATVLSRKMPEYFLEKKKSEKGNNKNTNKDADVIDDEEELSKEEE